MAKFNLDTLGKNSSNNYSKKNNVTINKDLIIEKPKKKESKTIRMSENIMKKIDDIAYKNRVSFGMALEAILKEYFNNQV